MSNKRVNDALISLGLSQTDAEVYLYLASKGPQEAGNIAETLRLQKEYLYRILENLANKGIVTFTFEQTTLFFAVTFNRALSLLVDARLKETEEIELNKEDILCQWQKMIEKETEPNNNQNQQ